MTTARRHTSTAEAAVIIDTNRQDAAAPTHTRPVAPASRTAVLRLNIRIAAMLAVSLLFCAALAFLWFGTALAQSNAAFAPASIELTVGKSLVLDSAEAIKRISVADPETADILLISPHQIYLTGKKPGATNLTLWGRTGRVSRIYDVTVSPDVARLKEMLHRVLPGEKNIRVMPAGDSITLSGTVSSSASLATANDLAKLYAPDKVANLLSVGGVHQVMLEVKVAEMHRSVVERLGIDLSYYMNGDFAYTLLTDLFALDNQNGPMSLVSSAAENLGADAAGNVRINSSRNGMFRFHNGQATWTGFLDVLKQNGLAKVLAEPTLICRSGEEAQFLAGGEIPIPVPQGMGTVAIEFKPYGVALAFTPVVLGEDRISLKVFPEVSELDHANALELQGFKVPAITSRRATTTVELGPGQSFAIAGLLQDHVREDIKKYPVLGDIPVLGTLFRSSQYQKAETELVIIVTPHLAKPLDVQQASLPTDHFTEPSELDFFLFGKMEGDSEAKAPAAAAVRPVSAAPAAPGTSGPPSGMDGEFGHILERQ